MKTNKKFRFRSPLFIVSTILSVLLMFIFVVWAWGKASAVNPKDMYGGANVDTTSIKGSVNYEPASETTPMKIWKEDDQGNKIDDFKIMTASDFHLNDSGDEICLDVLDHFMSKEQPDLVVLCGDNLFVTTNEKYGQDLGKFFEDRNQYWTFVLGNHDSQGWESQGVEYWQTRKNAFNVLTTGQVQDGGTVFPHCLARTIKNASDQSKYGYGFNRIDVIGKEDKIIQSLVFTDCETLIADASKVNEWWTAQNFDNDVMLFNHKPFVEMDIAAKEAGHNKDIKWNWGLNLETICYDSSEPNGLFNLMLNMDHHVTMIYGHDHVNNSFYSWKNVDMFYSLGLQYNMYNSRYGANPEYIFSKNIPHFFDSSIPSAMDGVSEFVIKSDKLVIGNKYVELTDNLGSIAKKKFLFFMTYHTQWATIISRTLLPLLAAGCITYYAFFIRYKISNRKVKTKK